MALSLLFVASSASAQGDSRDSESPFGVLDFVAWDHDWNSRHYSGDKVGRAAALMQDAGVAFVRMDFLWQDIEPRRGSFDFDRYDKIVDTLRARGIQILGLLEYNPDWRGTDWNAAPDREAYALYVRAVVAHFKDRVKYWEIWNEPDSSFYWQPQDSMKSYTALLKTAYPAVKEADPTAVVVLGGLAQQHSINLKRIYANGGGDSFDVVNIHPFVDPKLPNAIAMVNGVYKGVYKVMQANNDAAKPIWFTELGAPGNDDAGAKGWWLGKNPTEAEQAAWVTKIYTECPKWPGVQKVFWAFFRDTPDHFKNGVDHFGLIHENFSKKPAFDAYKRAVAAWKPQVEKASV